MVVVHEHGVQAVISVAELNDLFRAHPDRLIVANRDILKHFHESPLHVTRVGCLDSGVNETLSTSNCVEEELSCCESAVETVFDESLCGRVLGMVVEVGQRSVEESVGHSHATYCLLAYASNHLTEVNVGALSTAEGHDEGSVVSG